MVKFTTRKTSPKISSFNTLNPLLSSKYVLVWFFQRQPENSDKNPLHMDFLGFI